MPPVDNRPGNDGRWDFFDDQCGFDLRRQPAVWTPGTGDTGNMRSRTMPILAVGLLATQVHLSDPLSSPLRRLIHRL